MALNEGRQQEENRRKRRRRKRKNMFDIIYRFQLVAHEEFTTNLPGESRFCASGIAAGPLSFFKCGSFAFLRNSPAKGLNGAGE
jgi:hypothetical protein